MLQLRRVVIKSSTGLAGAHLVEHIANKIADSLASSSAPTIAAYTLANQIFAFLDRAESNTPKKTFQATVEALLNMRLLSPIEHVTPRAYVLFGRSSAPATEVICSLDPYAYVSHLSAMEYHGLTDRFPKILYLTRPSAAQWRKQAAVQMSKDLGARLLAYKNAGLPRLVSPKISRVDKTFIHFSERSQLGAFRLVSGSSFRVATIGRVFLDMLREPALCGGIQHVVDIYRREAPRFFKLIVDEVDRHGQPVDKIRIGYLLSVVCKLTAPEITNWQKFAQRGGSRRLDAEGEYVPIYSDQWMLSINVPSLTVPEGLSE